MKFFMNLILTPLSTLLLIVCLVGCGGKNATQLTAEQSVDYNETAREYFLQPGDNLDIKFFYNPELNENVTIRPDGMISLQLVDEVQAAGLTPSQLDEVLTKKYGSELRQATISVILKDFGGQRIYVGGEVRTPQEINPVGRINALQAIMDAGGFKNNAKLSSVVIVSKGSDNHPAARIVDLESALTGELPEEVYMLKPFDMVYVPRTKLAKASQFILQIYSFIPPVVGIGFGYQLHRDDD